MRGFTNRQPIVVSTSSRALRGNARSGLSITNGERVIDSTPPASKMSPSPVLIERAACEIVALDHRLDDARGEVIGAHGRQVAGVAADGRAERVDYPGVRHCAR